MVPVEPRTSFFSMHSLSSLAVSIGPPARVSASFQMVNLHPSRNRVQ